MSASRVLQTVVLLAASVFPAGSASAQTAITYQGQLKDGGIPADGSYNLTFKLFDSVGGVGQVGSTNLRNGVVLTNGLFSETLDFGAGAFTGAARWLEVAVNGSALSPRQPITAVPYALFAFGGPGGSGPWQSSGVNILNTNTGNVGIGTNTPHHRLRISGGPPWTSYFWGGAIELDNASAIGWQPNLGGQRFGIGQTTGGLYFFHTSSDPGTTTSIANYDMVVSDLGNVGIGVATPESKLDIAAQDALRITGYQPVITMRDANNSNRRVRIQNVDGNYINFFTEPSLAIGVPPLQVRNDGIDILGQEGLRITGYQPLLTLRDANNSNRRVRIQNVDGNYINFFTEPSLGTGIPPLQVRNDGIDIVGQNGLGISGFQPFMTLYDSNSGWSRGRIQNANGSLFFYTESSFASGIAPLAVLNSGRVKVNILEIAGADVAEKFPSDDKNVEPGTVMEIDPDNTGKLRVSSSEYSPRVAGVVSGAGNIPVGAVLGNMPGQDDAPAIALSGRVWVRCDASSDAIMAGDLLTTSSAPGHAMKAGDRERSHGAVLGKAMTTLAKGERGLVLVLVNLQ